MKPDDAAARQAHIHGWTLPQNYQPVLDLFREARFGPYARHDITWDDLVARHSVSLLGTAATMLLLLLAALWATLRSNRVLHENEASLRLAGGVFAHAEEGILITDASGHIVRANDSVSRITGYSQAELIGQTPPPFPLRPPGEGFLRKHVADPCSRPAPGAAKSGTSARTARPTPSAPAFRRSATAMAASPISSACSPTSPP